MEHNSRQYIKISTVILKNFNSATINLDYEQGQSGPHLGQIPRFPQ